MSALWEDNVSEDIELDQDAERVDAAVKALGEHFDTVHIFVTKYNADDKDTTAVSKGCGNIYAREGFIREWMTRQDEEAREKAREQ